MLALFSAALLDIMTLCGSGFAAAPVAVDPALYPRLATVSVPKGVGDGVVRVPVPVDLRSPRDPRDGSDLAVLAQDGQPLAVATVRGQAPIDRVPVRMSPTEDPDIWLLDPLNRPLDGLELDLPAKEWVARVAVDAWATDHWQPLLDPVLLWSVPAGAQRRIDLPATSSTAMRSKLRLRLVRLAGPNNRSPRVEGLLDTAPSVAPVELSLPVTQSVLEESGWSRYVVELPRPLPIDAVRVETDEPVFEREVDVALTAELVPGRYPTSDGTIRRVRLGGASLDQVTIPVTDEPAELLVLWVQSKGLVPLSIPTVTVLMEGEALLVPSPGPGPLTLLGGADPGTTATGDLDLATPELSRMVQATLAPGPVQPNPAWVAPEQRAGLAEPGTVLDMRGMIWVHDVEGPAGLVRIVLTPDVLADCKLDHSDLRLVDSTDHQIPFLLRRRLVEDDLGSLPFTRKEVGPQSRLRVRLPT
ncbi:MAG: DUF3999 domain-containing protein, partial [Oligoflexia bacterium]|nr:DUF3999 domain-containing protein [Oligoflexia bacterium]